MDDRATKDEEFSASTFDDVKIKDPRGMEDYSVSAIFSPGSTKIGIGAPRRRERQCKLGDT